MPHHGRVVRIEADDGCTSAEIVPELGGIVSSFVVPTPSGPEDLLYRHPFCFDPASTETRGGIPLLFPVCGRSMCDGVPGAWRHEGRVYPMPIHGFAMRRPWRVVAADRTSVSLSLSADDVTRAMFPFEFSLGLRVVVRSSGLRMELEIANSGDEDMPFACGFHPYLAAADDKAIVRHDGVARHGYDETFCGFAQPDLEPQNEVRLDDPAIGSVIHELAEARTAELAGRDGVGVRLRFGGTPAATYFPFLQLYRPRGAEFVCVEPWTAPPNALARPDRARRLPGGARDHAWLEIDTGPAAASLSR